MKSYQKLYAAFLAACLMTVAAFAADATPAGTWKWTQQGRQGGQGVERTLKLEYKEGKLTGTLVGASLGQFQIPDLPVEEGTFKDGVIKFSVTAEFNGNKAVTKYEGKLEGDTIKGASERPNPQGGEAIKRDWEAKRAK